MAGCVCKRGLFGLISHKENHLSTVSAVPKLGITYKRLQGIRAPKGCLNKLLVTSAFSEVQ